MVVGFTDLHKLLLSLFVSRVVFRMVLQAQPPKSPFQFKRSGTPGDAQNLVVGSFSIRIKLTDLLPLVFVLVTMLIVEFAEKIHGSVHVNFGVKLVIAGPRARIR